MAEGGDAKRARLSPLRVGGVPEHFNMPFHLAQERGLFAKHNVEVEFVNQVRQSNNSHASSFPDLFLISFLSFPFVR